MKIVREHINEIKQDIGGSVLGTIGVGSVKLNKKLKEYLIKEFSYSHLIHNDPHGNFISKLIGLSIEYIIEFGFKVDYFDLNEFRDEVMNNLLTMFGLCDKSFYKIQRGSYNEKERNFKARIEYNIWKDPDIVLEIKPGKGNISQIILYCNKNVIE